MFSTNGTVGSTEEDTSTTASIINVNSSSPGRLKRPPSLTEEYVVQKREGADGLSSSDDEPEGFIQIEIFEAATQDNKSGNPRKFLPPPSLNPLTVLVEEIGELSGERSPNSDRKDKSALRGGKKAVAKTLSPYPLPEINKI